MSDLRCLAHDGPPARPASPGRHDREAVWPRWRASGDRGESPAQAATDRPAPGAPAGAEPDAERPAALRIRVALPQSRTNPQGRHRRTPLDAPGVSSGVGASQVPPTVLVERRARRSPDRRGRARHSSRPSSSSSRAILGSAVHGLRASSRTRSGSTSTRTSCTACWRNTIAPPRAAPGPRGCRSSDTRRTACGAWISFAASPSCSGATGCSSSWTSARVASSVSASSAARLRAPPSVACSTPPYVVRARRGISAGRARTAGGEWAGHALILHEVPRKGSRIARSPWVLSSWLMRRRGSAAM